MNQRANPPTCGSGHEKSDQYGCDHLNVLSSSIVIISPLSENGDAGILVMIGVNPAIEICCKLVG